MTLQVREAAVEEIRPLRHAVLRPGNPPEDSRYPEDDRAVHVGAWDGSLLVGCATVFPQPWPGPPMVIGAWRLRGMAVAPERQGTGIGRRVLAAATAVARGRGAPLLWANARMTALDFYVKEGWAVAGPEFVTSDTGLPHCPIVLDMPND